MITENIINKVNDIGDLNSLNTTEKNSVVAAINETKSSVNSVDVKADSAITKAEQAFQSGVNVKNNMVQAINSKKTVPDLTGEEQWDTIVQRVSDIKESSGNAVVGDVLAGKTFTNNDGVEYTGTMVNRGGAVTVTPGVNNQVKPAGYYGGDITIAGSNNLIASNIKQGVSIFGVNGSLVEGKQWASGNITSHKQGDVSIPISLNFVPSTIYVTYDRIHADSDSRFAYTTNPTISSKGSQYLPLRTFEVNINILNITKDSFTVSSNMTSYGNPASMTFTNGVWLALA